MEKKITVKSSDGPEVTIIDGNQMGSVVIFVSNEDKNSKLEGFTITNGTGNYDSYWLKTCGGGIYCYDSSPMIFNNIIDNNECERFGGGIYCQSSSPEINNNKILNNSTIYGGGIGLRGSSPSIKNNIISSNLAYSVGGGVHCYGSSNPLITNNLITANKANKYGGGIQCRATSNPEIRNNTIYENSAVEEGGGFRCAYYSKPIILNTIFWNNTASNGKEIYLSNNKGDSTLTISYSDVEGGKALVYIESGCTLNWGKGMINKNPLFIDPDNGYFHLSQLPCQGNINPCVNNGDPNSSMIIGTTRTDCYQDEYIADMGFHYPDVKTPPLLIEKNGNYWDYTLSESIGGRFDFTLTAGINNAKRTYIILGSISGTEPGQILPKGKVVLPINWDIFTDIVIDLMNTPIFMNFMGSLDSSGNGAAIFNTQSPLPPGMVGVVFSYAYALAPPPAWDFVSNPTNIEVVQ